MMDSPFVRRVAVTGHLYDIQLARRPLSVYRNASELSEINALMTAPVLKLDDGRTFIDSSCICEYFDDLRPDHQWRLMPADKEARAHVRQVVARANATCEKVGQLYREWSLRPPGLRSMPTIERMHSQIAGGLNWLEHHLPGEHPGSDGMTHADVMSAITLTFVRFYAPSLGLEMAASPRLASLTAQLERHAAFVANPLE